MKNCSFLNHAVKLWLLCGMCLHLTFKKIHIVRGSSWHGYIAQPFSLLAMASMGDILITQNTSLKHIWFNTLPLICRQNAKSKGELTLASCLWSRFPSIWHSPGYALFIHSFRLDCRLNHAQCRRHIFVVAMPSVQANQCYGGYAYSYLK